MMKRMTKRLTYIVTIQSCSFCADVMLNGFVNELILCLKCREKLLYITTGFLKKKLLLTCLIFLFHDIGAYTLLSPFCKTKIKTVFPQFPLKCCLL